MSTKASTTYGKFIQQHQNSKIGNTANQASERGRPSIS